MAEPAASAVQRARAWYVTGCAETDRGEYATAAASFERALAIAPDWCEAQHNLGRALFEIGRVDDAVGCFERAALGPQPGLPRAMCAVAIPGSSADHAAVLGARQRWAREFLPPMQPGPSPRRIAPGDRLRVGYVSSFFHRPNWMKPVWALLNHHDRDVVEVHLLADSPGWTGGGGYRPHPADRVHAIAGLPSEEAAAAIERLGIDVLVDLNAFSKPARLPLYQWRPAPVVVSWFNMYATSGIPCFDYIVGDDTVIAPGEERHYCERVVRVDGTYLAFEPSGDAPDVVDAPCAGSGKITFGCLASQYKLTPQVFDAWGRILGRAPSSRLLLRNAALGAASVRRYVHDELAARGVAPSRFQLLGRADHVEFLRTYDAIDVALDPFPYSGGTTTMEAIWQGVPVLTFLGDRWASRTSASILHAAGLSEFVARDVDDYVDLASRLATSPDGATRLAALRRNMRAQVRDSDACNGPKLARSMERLYRGMHGARAEAAHRERRVFRESGPAA
ncbi:MAG TPA: tetratricopeptide repeat protein [Gemmatimonadaceae bacterium]|nr:tetratricopeptide repeat protein [Gemmatimonadaceae bacterium]